jgi:23S rRNA (adenine2503-C2)-methyltransferase
VNLIEYNPIDDGEFQQASEEDQCLHKSVEANGIVVKVRRSRGKDIDAACEQAGNKQACFHEMKIGIEKKKGFD